MPNGKDESRKAVNNAIINTGTEGMNRIVDAGNSSKKKREENRAMKAAQEKALEEKEKAVSAPPI